jgi:hypothetical protein
MISEHYKRIKRNAKLRFSDILKSAELIQGTAGRIRKLRLYLIDNTFVDIWYSSDSSYSYHWEQRNVRNAIYRHDNAPHKKWRSVSTFPQRLLTPVADIFQGYQAIWISFLFQDNYTGVRSMEPVSFNPDKLKMLTRNHETKIRSDYDGVINIRHKCIGIQTIKKTKLKCAKYRFKRNFDSYFL